jgi:ubiquinone/menaquinone biosynthesis C-methylase UbiE
VQDLAPFLDLLRCPRTGAPLQLEGSALVAEGGEGASYAVGPDGIPRFAEAFITDDGARQREHFERVASTYVECLDLPHVQEYMAFQDRLLLERIRRPVGTAVELCCGRGEALRLPGLGAERAVGVDVSEGILAMGRRTLTDPTALFVQGDALHAPLADGCADSVFMLGGIHHVPDRAGLFAEVRRLLRPGGWFYWREPLDDFLPWRLARRVIYRLSPALDEETEAPLRYGEMAPQIAAAGLELVDWRTTGFLAWCVMANADVLPTNRVWEHLPGVRSVARAGIRLDERLLALPGLGRSGTQVIGVARRPRP